MFIEEKTLPKKATIIYDLASNIVNKGTVARMTIETEAAIAGFVLSMGK